MYNPSQNHVLQMRYYVATIQCQSEDLTDNTTDQVIVKLITPPKKGLRNGYSNFNGNNGQAMMIGLFGNRDFQQAQDVRIIET